MSDAPPKKVGLDALLAELAGDLPKLPGAWCGTGQLVTKGRVGELRRELSLLDVFVLLEDAASHMDGSMSYQSSRCRVVIKRRPKPPKEPSAGTQQKKRSGHRHR